MRLFKNFWFLFLILFAFAAPDFAQRRQPRHQPQQSAPAKNAAQTNELATTAFEAIKSATDINERIEKLEAFLRDFPASDLRIKAIEFLIVSHVELGESDFRDNDAANGVAEFRDAAKAFQPEVADNLFNDVVAKLPFNVFFRAKLADERAAAIEIARIIEPKVRGQAARLLALANFYLTIENGAEAKRLAARAAELEPNSAAAQIALGMANRIDFDLEAAAKHYQRAAELDQNSTIAKRNLADVQRGIGKTDDALRLYRELLAANPADEAARSGLILTMFNAGQKDAAEKELNGALEQNPRNFALAANAAYWYAANNDGAKAVELANKAIQIEPRYVWANIALARGLTLQRQPLEAERALLFARQFGNFPTLDYELASAHLAAGLFDEARDDLKRSFSIKNGKLTTKLAGRRDAQADDFNNLLRAERRASTFQFQTANTEEENKKLRELLEFSEALTAEKDETVIETAAANFAAGADEMQTHRQIYAANRLLSSKKALPAVAELTKNVIANLDQSLDVPAATAAVLADELYEPRRIAQTRGEVVNVPTLDRTTLSKIMRGRVEELAGWTLFQENKFDEAVVRLRRAVGILPPNSAWWRSSLWKLGTTLDAANKPHEALDSLITSYKADQPSEARLAIIRSVYQRANGTLAGLDERLNATNAQNQSEQQPRAVNNAAQPNLRATQPKFRNPLPSVVAEIVPKTVAANQNAVKPEPTIAPTPAPIVAAASATPEATTEIAPKTETVVQDSAITQNRTSKPEPIVLPTLGETVVAPEARIAATKNAATPDKPQTAEQSALKESTVTEQPIAQPSPSESSSQNRVEPTVEQTPEKAAEKSAEKTVEKNAETFVQKSARETPAAAPTKSESTVEQTEQSAPRVVVVPINQTPTAQEAQPTPQTVAETPVKIEPAQTENVARINNQIENQAAPNEANVVAPTTSAKPRIVIQNLNEAAENQFKSAGRIEKQVQCGMQISQKQLVLSRNGGAATLIIAVNSAENAAKLNFTISSPTDIAVTPLNNEATNDFSRSFHVRSISEITKPVVVTFESPCGRQDVLIKVR